MVFKSVEYKTFESFLNWVSKNNTENKVVINWGDDSNNVPNTESITCLIEIWRLCNFIITVWKVTLKSFKNILASATNAEFSII